MSLITHKYTNDVWWWLQSAYIKTGYTSYIACIVPTLCIHYAYIMHIRCIHYACIMHIFCMNLHASMHTCMLTCILKYLQSYTFFRTEMDPNHHVLAHCSIIISLFLHIRATPPYKSHSCCENPNFCCWFHHFLLVQVSIFSDAGPIFAGEISWIIQTYQKSLESVKSQLFWLVEIPPSTVLLVPPVVFTNAEFVEDSAQQRGAGCGRCGSHLRLQRLGSFQLAFGSNNSDNGDNIYIYIHYHISYFILIFHNVSYSVYNISYIMYHIS